MPSGSDADTLLFPQGEDENVTLQPHRTSLHKENRYHPDWPLSADRVVGPAVLVNAVGKGTVLTFATSPDWSTASDHHLPETRGLLASAVRLLHPQPRLTIEAPVHVQAVVTDDPEHRTLPITTSQFHS